MHARRVWREFRQAILFSACTPPAARRTQNVRADATNTRHRIHPHMHGAQKHLPQTGVLSTLHAQARTVNRRHDTSAHIRAHARQGEYSMDLDILYSPQKMHIHLRMHAYADRAAMTLL